MMKNSRFTGSRVFVAMALLGLCSVPAAAQDQRPGAAKIGGFVGVAVMPSFTFDGETFDGQTVYKQVDGEELFFLPKLDKQPLIRGILGYRGRQASLEISYDRTQHDGTFVDVPLDATYQAINLDGRYFFATTSRVQPHVLVGASFPWLTIKEGSFLDPDTGDVRLRGYGLNTEAGVTVFPTPQLGIGVGYSYRVLWFDRGTGVSDTLFELRPRFRETAGSVVITGTFVF
jgi:opacity protein-like surface antigen